MSALFELIANWPAQLSLIAWSAASGVGMAWVFKFTSNQAALALAADGIRAQLFAIKLFKDDLSVIWQCQVRLLKAIGLRLLHALPPLFALFVPAVLLLTQLSRWYQYHPLTPGETAVVQLQLASSSWETYRHVALQAPKSIGVESDPLRDEEHQTVYWRIRPTTAGPAMLRWQLGTELVEKTLAVGDDPSRLQAVSVRRPGCRWLDRLLHPGEPGFSADSPVRGIEVQHSRRATPLLGINIPWWLTFLVVSMVAATLARPWLKVRF